MIIAMNSNVPQTDVSPTETQSKQASCDQTRSMKTHLYKTSMPRSAGLGKMTTVRVSVDLSRSRVVPVK
jgi:hypothetical protein